MKEDILTDPVCPHVRVRLVADSDADEFDETGPLVVRLDDEGRTTVIGGWQGSFNPAPIGYAWKHFGDPGKVCRYLESDYEALAEFVGVPDRRTFAYVVVAHPQWVSEFGGEGEERPDEWWVKQHLRQTSEEASVYAARKGRKWIVDYLISGSQERRFEDGRGDEITVFSEWEAERWSSYLDLGQCEKDAADQLSAAVHDCKKSRRSHGA